VALPYARKQLVQYLTGKVIENVTKQIADQAASQLPQPAAPEQGEATAASPDIARLVDSINAAFAQTYEQIEALEARIELVDRRMTRLEKRWGRAAMVRVIAIVVVTFILGFAAYQLLHLAGVGL
jgi:hypothetical protein